MITIRFYQNRDKGSIHMTMEGHAGAAPKGKDLVCAAATMLAYTAAQAVAYMQKQGALQKNAKIKIRKGSAEITAVPKAEAFSQVRQIFWVAQCGAHVLARNYPENVTLDRFEDVMKM